MSNSLAENANLTTSAAGTYVRNICALWQFDAKLAMALDAVHPDDRPTIEPAKDGGFTVKVAKTGVGHGGGAAATSVYLHSKYKPLAEAASWAQNVSLDEKYVVIVSGFGLGYHVKALWERMPDDGMLIVAENNIPLLRAALETLDISEMLTTGRVLFFTELDRAIVVERLEPRSVLFTSGTLFAAHAPSVQVAGDFHAAFQKLITEFVAFTRTGFVTLMLNNVATCRNIASNLGCYVTAPPIDTMHNYFAGMPAILVAAGPSLQKNMHLLHEVKGNPDGTGRRAVIIAVQTMLKPLLAAGIEPDFVTSLDYNTVSTRFFENLEDVGMKGAPGRVHLVAEAKANWNVLDVFRNRGGTMSVTQNDFADRLLREAFPRRQGLKAGATVAHLSFYLAEFLGCDPLILIGQDLGFVDGLYYKPGVAIHETWAPELGRFNTLETKEWERIARSRAILRKIPDIHGHPMYTEEQFFVYLQQFERDFAASRCRVIDATEGGAKKQGVTVMTLRAAMDAYCSQAGSRGPSAVPWKAWACDVPTQLARCLEAVKARRASAQEMMDTCAQTIPLLEEMKKHREDETRMNKLFIEIDRIRSKVGNDPQTFEMVCHLNTIGELRRFQHDLSVKSAGKDNHERQRRQLTRDVDYVKNLRIGAERLLEILNEAIIRLEKQIDASKAGKPWPREVAGGTG